MGNPVMFFEIASKQGELLRDFYRDLFDWTILPFNWNIPHFPNDIFAIDPTPPPLDDKGIKGHIYPLSDDMDFSNRVSIFIQVEDLQETLEKIEIKGGKTLVPPQELPDSMGSIAMFLDPSGNVVGLHQI
ncbi:VOC family protein [Candidatus Poribacteria bacterium]|nr:MAG: VOC family protein [Candidatus Poribacteria bacterium]